MKPILYSFRRCPYAMRARLAIAVSGVQVELREILLRDKAKEFLQMSPKGTVPVVQDGENLIEESFDIMLWALQENDPEGWLSRKNDALITACDGPFKSSLDAYKYDNNIADRDSAADYLRKLDDILANDEYLSGGDVGLTDMAIVTFVRQYANVDRTWFNAQPWPHLLRWLTAFLESERFAAIMQKYPVWQTNDPITLFPEVS